MCASRVNPTCVDRSSPWRSPDQRCTPRSRSRCIASGTRDCNGRIPHYGFTCQTAQLVPAPALLRPGFASLLHSPPLRGGRSAERRSGVCETPVGHAVTRRVRRLRGALRPMTRDARLSALHRGGFRHRVRAFQSPNTRLRRSFGRHPDPSQRAPRSQVIVPDGRGPGPPGAAVTSRHRRTATPRSAFRMSPDDAPSKSEATNLLTSMHFVVKQ
jgi:hypothetical protein